jgi:hypothetical protein
MAGVLPPDMVVRVLNPIVKTGDFPVNQVRDSRRFSVPGIRISMKLFISE